MALELYRRKQQESQEAKDIEQDVKSLSKRQTKTVISTNGAGIKSTFNNLEIGKKYKVFGRTYADGINSPGNFNLFYNIVNGATVVTDPFSLGQVDGQDSDRRYTISFTESFTATATTLDFVVSAADQLDSYSIKWTLEELPNQEETTQWT